MLNQYAVDNPTLPVNQSFFPTHPRSWRNANVELVDSVDDLQSSCSVRGLRMPNFEVLDAKIAAAALNRIIRNTQFKRKVSLEEQEGQREDRFLRGRHRLPDLRIRPLGPTILSRIMPTHLQLFFEMMIFRSSIRNGDRIPLSMTKIPSDDILESLYKLRI